MTNAEFNVTFGINVEDSSKSKRSKLSNTFKELKEEAEGYKDELEKALKVEEALLGMDLKKEAKKQGITFRGKNGKETAEWKKFKTDYNAALFTTGENVSNASSRISIMKKCKKKFIKDFNWLIENTLKKLEKIMKQWET